MRIYTISDIHIDFKENADWISDISNTEYQKDALILAGDVAHNFELLCKGLEILNKKFAKLFFVPGNHDLWVLHTDFNSSIEKFEALQKWCSSQNILFSPELLGAEEAKPVWIVPLFSWYTQPEEGADNLYLEKPGEDKRNRMWSDNYYVKWGDRESDFKAAQYFAGLNNFEQVKANNYPVISFSHFLPRQEIMFGASLKPDPEKARKYDRNPKFNFSRVAGSLQIEKQIRQLGSAIHIYGHQHINRDRELDGVRYVSHCLAYPEERRRGMVRGIEHGLKLVWNTQS